MAEKSIDLGLTALDELFMTDEGRKESKLPRIYDIPLDQIDDMPNHPFKVRENDEDMAELVESVKFYGVLTPVILRQKEDGRYECAAGHRRRTAARLAGHTTIKAEVRDITHDEAIIIMAHTNRQRSKILPSEKAFAYKMELEALRRQAGRPSLNNACPVGAHFSGKRSDEILASESPDSARQIQRYVRLTNLCRPLLDMVDDGRIAFRPAVELSYLTENEQQDLLDTIASEEATPSLQQATKMKEFSAAGKLNADVILSIMCEQKPNQKEKISFRVDKLRPFLPKNLPSMQVEQYILKALDYYNRAMKNRGRDR